MSLTLGCNEYYPYMSVIIASVAGVVYLAISDLMQKLKIDDPLDAVAVHGGPGKTYISHMSQTIKLYSVMKWHEFAGLWGVIAAALFKKDALFTTGNFYPMIWNLIGAAAIIGWYLVASTLLFLGLKILGLFRIAEHLERTGLDAPYHSEPAYVFSSKPPSKYCIAKPGVIGLIDLVIMKILSFQ